MPRFTLTSAEDELDCAAVDDCCGAGFGEGEAPGEFCLLSSDLRHIGHLHVRTPKPRGWCRWTGGNGEHSTREVRCKGESARLHLALEADLGEDGQTKKRGPVLQSGPLLIRLKCADAVSPRRSFYPSAIADRSEAAGVCSRCCHNPRRSPGIRHQKAQRYMYQP